MLAGAVTGAAGGIFLNKKNCHHRNTTQRITHSWCMVEGGPRRREGRGSNSRREKKHTRKDIKTKPEDGQRYGSFQFCVFSPVLLCSFLLSISLSPFTTPFHRAKCISNCASRACSIFLSLHTLPHKTYGDNLRKE